MPKINVKLTREVLGAGRTNILAGPWFVFGTSDSYHICCGVGFKSLSWYSIAAVKTVHKLYQENDALSRLNFSGVFEMWSLLCCKAVFKICFYLLRIFSAINEVVVMKSFLHNGQLLINGWQFLQTMWPTSHW